MSCFVLSYKLNVMNKVVDKFCGPFTKNKQRIQRFMETGDTKYIYRNELDKACFQHNMAYGDFKDLKRRTQSDKVLKDKVFEIVSNPKYIIFWYQNFFNK